MSSLVLPVVAPVRLWLSVKYRLHAVPSSLSTSRSRRSDWGRSDCIISFTSATPSSWQRASRDIVHKPCRPTAYFDCVNYLSVTSLFRIILYRVHLVLTLRKLCVYLHSEILLTSFSAIFSIMLALYMRRRWSSNAPLTHKHGFSSSRR